jgi:hypothetical protein
MEERKSIEVCLWCREEFTPKARTHLYHSPKCSFKFNAVRRRVIQIYQNSKKLLDELSKLQDLGKNYRFEDENLNVLYDLGMDTKNEKGN